MYQNFIPYPDPVYIPNTRHIMPEDTRHMMPPARNLKLVRAYVLHQPYIGLFPLAEGLAKGTIFPNLYMPYPEKR